jgi:hypothetical protein
VGAQADVFGEACALEHGSGFRLHRPILQAAADIEFEGRVSHTLQNGPEIENLQAMACIIDRRRA